MALNSIRFPLIEADEDKFVVLYTLIYIENRLIPQKNGQNGRDYMEKH